MLTLFAESKTMSDRLSQVSMNEFETHKPCFEANANAIISFILSQNPGELSSRIGISPALASKAIKMAYDFTFKNTGLQAISAFTGKVFRSLDINTIPASAISDADQRFIIVSSLYGILKPSDIIKPYRLDYNKDCSPDGSNLIEYWNPIVTKSIVSRLEATGEQEILNLLPGYAAKFIDWKIIKNHANVLKPDFKTIDKSGLIKTPHSGKLKALRGKMIRIILMQNICSFKKLMDSDSNMLCYDENLSKPGQPVFLALG